MQTLTPAAFANKMSKVATAVQNQDKKAIAARAAVTEKVITATAVSRSGLARKYATSKRWVRSKPLPGDAALVNMRGGFAFLAEKGSWHYPNGWDMIPTDAQAMTTPYGVFSAVKHPALRAHPFWHSGVAAAEKPGLEAYRKEIRNSIAKAVR